MVSGRYRTLTTLSSYLNTSREKMEYKDLDCNPYRKGKQPLLELCTGKTVQDCRKNAIRKNKQQPGA